jgi:hypothetical protein
VRIQPGSHLFSQDCRATPEPLSHLRIAGSISHHAGTVSGSGPAERGQRETLGQAHDRNKAPFTLLPVPSLDTRTEGQDLLSVNDVFRQLQLAPGPLVHRDVPAGHGERLAVPAAPALAEAEPGELRHEVQL